MKLLKYLPVAFCFVLLVGIAQPRVRADAYNQKTFVTFSGPVEIPAFHGARVIPAGTYVFKLLNTLSDRNIVQIFNKRENHLYSTIIAVPDYRIKPTGHTVIKFAERAQGSPVAVRAWFYPGDKRGQEFVYPKVQARELAKANHEPVLSLSDADAANMDKPIHTGHEASAAALENAKITAEQPNGEEVKASSVVQSNPSPGSGQGHE